METITLDSGLRIVVGQRPGQVVYCGIAVGAGTRHQKPTESGMAHFIEHMSFKGTERRRSWHIINRMEAVGGDLNAYTGKEHTVYYCSTLRQHLERALDLLFDITLHSTYPQHEMDKEVEVVIDEIESYNDSPAELIYDDFEALLFPGQPLGRNILGDAQRLRSYTSADLHRFARRMYAPQNMVLFVLGDGADDLVRRTLRAAKTALRQPGPNVVSSSPQRSIDEASSTYRLATPAKTPLSAGTSAGPNEGNRVVRMEKGTHQAHVIVGCRTYPLADPRYVGLYLLNNILGGPGMNSRLNLSLRERRGLVYTVESSLTGYTDTGVWTTYFGCDHADVDRCRRLVATELQRLADKPLTPSALAAAKRQLCGQVALSWDNGENVAISMGRRMLHLGSTLTLEQHYEQIHSLTAPQLWDIARETFAPERLFTLIYT